MPLIVPENDAVERDAAAQNRKARTSGPQPALQVGVYRHFKGQLYEVLGAAPIVDSENYFVIYRPLYGDGALVLRLLSEFTGTVIRDGGECLRFEFVEPLSSSFSTEGIVSEHRVSHGRSQCGGLNDCELLVQR